MYIYIYNVCISECPLSLSALLAQSAQLDLNRRKLRTRFT